MQEEHINIYYVCIDASNCDYTISTATQFAIGEILDGDDFFAWYPMDYQNPERIKFAGDFTYLYYKNQEAGTFPSADLTTTDYNVMKQYYTVMTEEQSEKFQIVDGELALREDKLTEQEKLWADDKNIPYM